MKHVCFDIVQNIVQKQQTEYKNLISMFKKVKMLIAWKENLNKTT